MNKEWQQTVGVVFEIQRLPVQDFAVGALARAWGRAFCDDASLLEFCGEGCDVSGMGGPADQARFRQLRDEFSNMGTAVLLRIGRDDFEIATGAQREQRVLRATTGVDSAECGADSAVFFDKVDAALEIVAAEKDVVEHRWHLINQRGMVGSALSGGKKKRGSETSSHQG